MKIIFGTCISGNGHQTQAIATKQYLEENNIKVCCNLVGKPFKGSLPKYFNDEFNIIQHKSFDFVFDSEGRVIIWKTILKNTLELPRLITSFIKICNIIRKEKPDAIFNYYEPLVGLTALFFRNIKYVSFGHQYAMDSKIYPRINGYPVQKLFLGIINKITSIRAKIVALSYYEFNDDTMIVSPPILRKESYIKSDKKEEFILVYLMNEDILPQLIDQAKKYPDEKFEVFTKLTKTFDIPNNITLFNLNGQLFQERMRSCKAVICSGGFETTSEAILQKKPILMIPIPNHYEQYANCNDAMLHGYASWNKTINLEKLPHFQIGNDEWFYKYEEILNKILTQKNNMIY